MTRVIHRLLAAVELAALLATACSSFAVADTPIADSLKKEHELRMPDVLLPLRDLYPNLPVPTRLVWGMPAQLIENERPAWVGASITRFNGMNGGSTPRSTQAWENLGSSITRSGVRLLTLWDSRASNFTLQAGKHGTASLQWTGKLFSGDAAPGLLNQLFELANHAP